MSEPFKQTVKIIRKPKEGSDDSNRNVWSDPIETIELELVSTGMLRQILKSGDEDAKKKIEEVAMTDQDVDGVLAHDTEKNDYEIVDTDGNDDFSLVSTQMLRKILGNDDVEQANDDIATVAESGCDPYNSD